MAFCDNSEPADASWRLSCKVSATNPNTLTVSPPTSPIVNSKRKCGGPPVHHVATSTFYRLIGDEDTALNSRSMECSQRGRQGLCPQPCRGTSPARTQRRNPCGPPGPAELRTPSLRTRKR